MNEKRTRRIISTPKFIYLGGILAFAALFLLFEVAPAVFANRGHRSSKNQIINNLRQLDGAKEQWALENHQTGLVAVAREDLAPYFKNGRVQDVAGEVYVINPNGVSPVAVLTKDLGESMSAGSILQLDGPIISGLGLPAESTLRRR